MRFAFVIYHYFPYGGLQRDAMRLAKACLQQGNQVEFLVMHWQGARDAAIPVHFFPQNAWLNYLRYRNFSNEVQRFIKRNAYDGVIGFNKMPGLDIYYAGDLCYAATFYQKPLKILYQWIPRYRYLLRVEAAVASIKSKTHILVMNEKAIKDFQYYYQTPSQRLHLLPPGISRDRCWNEEAEIKRVEMRKTLGISDKDKIILMVGSSFDTKGVDRAIEALAALPENLRNQSHLIIVGKGKPKAYLQLAEKRGVDHRVKFILGSEDVPALLFSADMLLHPAYRENAGMILLEATVAGLPVLTTANCGYAHYIEKAKSGYVLPEPFVQDALNVELARMLTTQELAQWKENGIRFGKEADIYSLPVNAAKIINYILRK